MAIVIPSSKTYDRQNPKVRDNVIERIEVSAKEVVPDNEYETPVYNSDIDVSLIQDGVKVTDIDGYTQSIVGTSDSYEIGNYIELTPKFIKNFTVSIPKLLKNKYINYLYLGKDEKENYNVNINIYYDFYEGTSTAKFKHTIQASGPALDEIKDIVNNYPSSAKQVNKPFKPFTEQELSNDYQSTSVSIYSKLYSENDGVVEDISGNTNFKETEEYYSFNISFLSEYEKIIMQGESQEVSNDWFTINGSCEKYISKKIEITVYGNTIGIDLTDKTVYINGETQKKVHSIDGNELMQTSNYTFKENNPVSISLGGELSSAVDVLLLELFSQEEFSIGQKLLYNNEIGTITSVPDLVEGTDYYTIRVNKNGEWETSKHKEITVYTTVQINAINFLFEKTQKNYKNGKETATIRCSISDYFDYENGDKVVSIDNSTGKMSFKMYDQVIPMVYGADRQDHPMSTYQDGSAKVFQVLGSNIYYDGAVWQELSLQEVDKDGIK